MLQASSWSPTGTASFDDMLEEPRLDDVDLSVLLSGSSDIALTAAYAGIAPAFDSDLDDTTPLFNETPGGVVTARYRYVYDDGGGGGGSSGSSGGDGSGHEGGGGSTSSPGQTCANTNEIENAAPDGATYYSPEGVTSVYLAGALNHVASIFANNPFNKAAVVKEIRLMYTYPTHQYFVDFKDWGTTRGPVGSRGGGLLSYYSEAAGRVVTGSAFEPFGNYFYGYLCTFGGLSPEETYGAAALFSESGLFMSDDPQDVPHVQNGIADAQKWLAGNNEEPIRLVDTKCG